MSILLPFANNNIQVFAYEGFDYVISNPNPSATLQTVSNSTGLNPQSLFFTKDGNDSYRFAVSDLQNNLTAGTTEQFVLTTTGPSAVSSNTVSISPGRFLDGSGVTLSNRSFTFFKSEAIPQIRLVAPSFTVKQPISIPTLPPGVTFVRIDSNIFDISGVPLVTVPNSNYQIIGVQDGGSKVVTTRINIVISNERVRLNLDGTSTVNMTVGTPITPRILTAIPPLGTSVLRYTFPTFPDGIVVTDNVGTVRTSPFLPTDPSYTMVVTGTPTLAAAYSFRNANATASGFPYTIQASRTAPVPLVENTQSLQFAFGETVLFDVSTIPTLYTGVPLVPGQNFFRAQTYFTSNVAISNIVSPDLRSDLSLVFVPGTGRADLSGTPLTAGSGSFTIRAVNSNGFTRDYVTPINVSNDTVSFSRPLGVDLCYSFILSRPVDQVKEGYYTSNIQFVATAGSGRPVVLSAPALGGTGLSLDSNGVIVGIPSTVTPLTDLNVVATVLGSPATATKTVKFSILDDVFTFANVPAVNLEFVQNVPVIPFQFPVTTLSGRNVIDFTQSGLPSGLFINPAGILSGTPISSTPLSGNATITTTTGFASGPRDFSYNVTPDSVLVSSPISKLDMTPGGLIGPLQIQGSSFSGATVSNYQLSNLTPTFGITINPVTGVLNGTLGTGIPPDPEFPASSNFTIRANSGVIAGQLGVTFTTINPYVRRSYVSLQRVALQDGGGFESNQTSIYYSDNYSNWYPTDFSATAPITDFYFKYASPDANEINYLQFQSTPGILRYTVGPEFSKLDSDNSLRAFTTDGSGTWWAVANPSFVYVDQEESNAYDYFSGDIQKSIDNGTSWTSIANIPGFGDAGTIAFFPRSAGGYAQSNTSDPYRTMGISFKYKDGVMLLGGITKPVGNEFALNVINTSGLMRSIDDGTTWTSPTSFAEVAGFNVDNSSIWLAYGSSLYRTDIEYGPPPTTDAITLKYSTDQGSTWADSLSSSVFFTYDITYGNGTWISTGLSIDTGFTRDIRFSTNGSNWSTIDLSTNALFPQTYSNPRPPIGIGPVMFNGDSWNVFVSRPLDVNDFYSDIRTELYRHDVSSSLASNWTSIDLSGSFPDLPYYEFTSSLNSRVFVGYGPNNLIKSTGLTPIPSLQFSNTAGPTILQPLNRSFLQYQYVPIAPIQLSGSGSGTVYFFITADELPPGLRFNPITRQITGTPAQAGQVTTTVYAQDSVGVSTIVLSFNTIIPRIIRKQEGAGAYTSLLRQYTDVLGAQNARDNRVLPNQERGLGEFMSPEAPDVITQSNGCCPK